MLMLLDWELTLRSTGVNAQQANKMKCVFTILKVIHIRCMNDLFGNDPENLFLLKFSEWMSQFLVLFKNLHFFFFVPYVMEEPVL